MMNSTNYLNYFLRWKLVFLSLILPSVILQAATLSVSTNNLNIEYNQYSTSFTITSDVSWTISHTESWLYLTSSGSGNSTVTVTFYSNTTSVPRQATITIAGTGVTSQTITITQAAVPVDNFEANNTEETASTLNAVFNNDAAIIQVDGATIHSTTDVDYYKVNLPVGCTYSFNSTLFDAENTSNTYNENVNYSFKIDNGSWSIAAAVILPEFIYAGGGSVYFKVTPYQMGNCGNYALKITITRGLGTPELTPSTLTANLNADGSSIANITVTSNTKWDITNTDKWLAISPKTGNNNLNVSVIADGNPSPYSRTATLLLTANGALSKTITINQDGFPLAPESYEPNETEVTATELAVNFTSNMANVVTKNARIGTTSDIDFYKIFLPAGYTYAVSALLHSYYDDSNELKGGFYYKVGTSGTWSSENNLSSPDFTFAGGDYIYFKISPFTPGTMGTYSLEVNVNQNSITPIMSVSTTSIDLAANDKSSATFTINSNSGWKVTSANPWITMNPTSGWGNGTVTVTALGNSNSWARSTNITVSCIGITKASIAVNQASGGSYLADSYEPNNSDAVAWTIPLTFTNDTARIKITGANIHSSIDGDCYKALLPAGYTYIISSRINDNSYAPDGNYYSLNAQYAIKKGVSGAWSSFYNNSSPDISYTGGDYLYFLANAFNTGDVGTYQLEATIIRYAGTHTLTVSATDFTINATANSNSSFTITSANTNWKVISSETWVTPSLTSGTGNATITLTTQANVNISSRVAFITVSGNGVLTSTIAVVQNACDLAADIYEPNNTPATAYVANVVFNNNVAHFTAWGANLNNLTDLDYYKISLPAGYNYSISSKIIDNPPIGLTVDGEISYKIGDAGTWSSTYTTAIPTFVAMGATDLYIKAESYYTYGCRGIYELDINITRMDVLDISKSILNISAPVGINAVNIVTSSSWTASSSDSWLTVSSANGSGSGVLTLSAEANVGISARTATITVTGSGVTKTITVIQATSTTASLTLSTTTINVANIASTTSFDIASNISWTAVRSSSWISPDIITGINNATITISVEPNTTIAERTAFVIISGSGITRTIAITQAGTASLTMSTNTLNLGTSALSSGSFAITSNVAWTASTDQSWISVSPSLGSGNATITATATTANTATTDRTATITIKGTGVAAQTIAVTQAATTVVPVSTLTVSATTLNITADATNASTFNIASNVSWTISSNQTWLTISSASGSNDAAISLTAVANISATNRTAIITITGSGISRTVTVTQLGKTTGIDNISVTDIKFYPNPVNNKLTIELDDQSIQNKVLILSEKGECVAKEVYKASYFDINMITYKAGVYFIKIVSAKGTKTIKILKN